jgi:2-octaprenyl-6-methoxyphenol hydroxylase
MSKKHSVVIVGSGPIALSAVLLFIKNEIDVGIIIDKKKVETRNNSPSRLFAIAHNSYEILREFVDLSSQSQVINHIRIVDDNSHAKVDFSPPDIGLDTFGCMIDEGVLVNLLYSKLIKSNVNIYEITENFKVTQGEFFAEINYGTERIYTPLVVAADGKYSSIRRSLSVKTTEHDYNQTAIVIDIRHSSWPHKGVAVEKFTPSGPFAILPKYQENGTISSLVWVEKGKLKDLDIFSEDDLKELILRKLDDYLGDIQLISKPAIFNLNLIESKERFCKRVVFVGDSAQSIHPIAGQGFNLGLRDVVGLIKHVSHCSEIGLDYGKSLNEYSKLRDSDTSKMILSTTILNSLFANDILPLKIVRRLGLSVFDKTPQIKRIAMRYASGL